MPTDGNYTLAFDAAQADVFINRPEGQLQIDSMLRSPARRLPVYYKNHTDTFPLDRYGNEALPRQDHLVALVDRRDADAAEHVTRFSSS